MNHLPQYHINPDLFWHDPYPALKKLRETAPIAFVPELGAILISRRADIAKYEKRSIFFLLTNPADW